MVALDKSKASIFPFKIINFFQVFVKFATKLLTTTTLVLKEEAYQSRIKLSKYLYMAL